MLSSLGLQHNVLIAGTMIFMRIFLGEDKKCIRKMYKHII